MKKIILILLFVCTCSVLRAQVMLEGLKVNNSFEELIKVDTVPIERDPLKIAEKNAEKDGRKVLQTGRIMALENQDIVRGSCWTYINEVFTRAGYGTARYNVFRSKHRGPYADSELIKAGDWLYYVNHSFHNVGHSGIFVRWIDKAKQIALILSYTGRNRKKPGRYKQYKIDNVFHITRAGNI